MDVYGTQIAIIVTGAYKPTNITSTGAHIDGISTSRVQPLGRFLGFTTCSGHVEHGLKGGDWRGGLLHGIGRAT